MPKRSVALRVLWTGSCLLNCCVKVWSFIEAACLHSAPLHLLLGMALTISVQLNMSYVITCSLSRYFSTQDAIQSHCNWVLICQTGFLLGTRRISFGDWASARLQRSQIWWSASMHPACPPLTSPALRPRRCRYPLSHLLTCIMITHCQICSCTSNLYLSGRFLMPRGQKWTSLISARSFL